jgi:transcriptional regulator with AAA-type ATPase domain
VSAARDPLRSPVLVFGEPGLCKDNVATLLHFGGPDKFRIMVQVRPA